MVQFYFLVGIVPPNSAGGGLVGIHIAGGGISFHKGSGRSPG